MLTLLQTTKNDICSPEPESKDKRETPQYRLSGSDIDPHPLLVKRSNLIVDRWLDKCETAVATSHEQHLDNASVVSVPGGFCKRPRIDLEVWYRPLRSVDTSPASFTPCGREGCLPHHQHQTDANRSLGDSKLDLDLDLDLDKLVIEDMSKTASPRRKVKFMEKLFSAFHPKKPKNKDRKHGQQRRVKYEDEEPPQRRRVKRDRAMLEDRDLMVQEHLQRLPTISRHDTNLSRSRNFGASDATSNSKEARSNIDEHIEGWESDTSVLSSRDSEINLGSIMGQPATPSSIHLSTESLPFSQESRNFQPSPPKPISSWSDSRSRSRNPTNVETSRGAATSSSTPRPANTLLPSVTSIIPPLSTTGIPIRSDFDKNRERRRAERNMSMPLPVKTTNSVQRTEPDHRGASPVANDLRDRRAVRASKIPLTEKYYREDRERLWSSQKSSSGNDRQS